MVEGGWGESFRRVARGFCGGNVRCCRRKPCENGEISSEFGVGNGVNICSQCDAERATMRGRCGVCEELARGVRAAERGLIKDLAAGGEKSVREGRRGGSGMAPERDGGGEGCGGVRSGVERWVSGVRGWGARNPIRYGGESFIDSRR